MEFPENITVQLTKFQFKHLQIRHLFRKYQIEATATLIL